jgi:hypothetical protein
VNDLNRIDVIIGVAVGAILGVLAIIEVVKAFAGG